MRNDIMRDAHTAKYNFQIINKVNLCVTVKIKTAHRAVKIN